MAHNALIDGVTYQITGGKVLVDGTVYDIKKGRTLVGGTGYDISFGTPLSSLDVGSSVYLNVDGVPTEFIIVHQGNPNSSLYDDSCDGVWLMMKDLYEEREFDDADNNYKASSIHNYLNGTFLGLFDSDIQSAIKQVKIPYQNGTGSSGSILSGSSGLSAKVFLLSGYEVGWTSSISSDLPIDGAKLDYFTPGTTTAANRLRIGYYNGSTAFWWLRSTYKGNQQSVWSVDRSGKCYDMYSAVMPFGIRPALILPHDTVIDDDYCVIT